MATITNGCTEIFDLSAFNLCFDEVSCLIGLIINILPDVAGHREEDA